MVIDVTGSSIVGNWITLILAVLLVLLGVFVLWMLIIGTIWPEWHAQRDYVQGSATIVDKQLASDPTDARRYRLDVTIGFTVEQESYRVTTYDIHRQFTPGKESQQQQLDELQIGQVVECWYDPDDPTQVVIRRGLTWWIWPLLLVPLGLLLSGGVLLTRLCCTGIYRPSALPNSWVSNPNGCFKRRVKRMAKYCPTSHVMTTSSTVPAQRCVIDCRSRFPSGGTC